MSIPSQHIPENERLMAVRRLDVLETSPAHTYDEVVQLAARICEVPVALIVLVYESKQFIKAKVGFDLDETPREGWRFRTHLQMNVLRRIRWWCRI